MKSLSLPESGVYKKRLYKILITTGASILLLLSALLWYTIEVQGRNSYLRYLSDSISTQESNSRISMTVITRTISDALRNNQLAQWAAAQSRSDYYYCAISAQKQLQIITTDSSFISYDLAVTTLAPKSFEDQDLQLVLKKTGSSSADTFFMKEKGLTANEMRQVFHHFSNSRDPMVIPHYTANTLESIYYLTKSNLPESNLLFIITIPSEVLTGSAMDNAFFLWQPQKILACSKNDEASLSYFDGLARALENRGPDSSLPFKYGGSYVFVSSIPSMGWKIAYVNDGFMPSISQISLFLLFSLVLTAAALYAIVRLADMLYRPVGEAVAASLENTAMADGPIDEFKLIKQNCEKIQSLGKCLNEALQANNQLASRQYCRELLYSPATVKLNPSLNHSLFPLPEASYSVALIEFSDSQGNCQPGDMMIRKEQLREYTISQSDTIYVDMDYSCCALILWDKSSDHIMTCLKDLVFYLESQTDTGIRQRIALSDAKKGIQLLYLGYQEALRILEYKHLYAQSPILTYSQIAAVDATTYSYPLSTENRLVHYILDGNEEALHLFDQLIRTNLLGKTLSIESIQSFVYSLIGTIGRVFQELKTTPEHLLSEKIEFKYWYDHWSESVTITQIRQSIQDTLAAIHRKSGNNDQQLLDQLLALIHDNYADDIMLNDMADRFNISPKYCGILFKQLSGSNFKDYLNRYRVEKAKILLEKTPHIKIVDLSAMVGFNSANSFIRVFRKYTGVSPKLYGERDEDGDGY